MFFSDWESILRVVVLAVCAYAAVLTALRVFGARALAKMSAYDLVITIALGSLIATIPLQKQVTLADGLAAIGTYLLLQFIVAWALRRSRLARRLVKERPTLVLWDGRVLSERLDTVNVTRDEIDAAVRSAGKQSLSQILAVVLENDGSWSVIPRGAAQDMSALSDLNIPAMPTS